METQNRLPDEAFDASRLTADRVQIIARGRVIASFSRDMARLLVTRRRAYVITHATIGMVKHDRTD